MAKLIYIANASLDGFTEDEAGKFDWSVPSREVLASISDLERPIGTHLYGRRMYETMAVWETAHTAAGQPAFMPGLEKFEREFAQIWRAANKIVYSTSIEAVSSARTRIERACDPEAVRRMKARAERDLTVGGPTLAAHLIRAGLVDEYHLYVHPIVLGGGKKWLPNDVRIALELLDEQRFGNGVVHVHYRARS
jgi:dihydrofolate reductase